MGLRKKLITWEQGQALVEFSFICVILLMLAGGVVDGVSVIRYNIALSGAATEVVNQISSAADVKNRVGTICNNVIMINFHNSLGDRNTTYRAIEGDHVIDKSITYSYHVDGLGDWSGHRAYTPITVILERDQVLLSPFGQLVFGDPGNGGRRHMKVTAQARVYMN